MSTPSTTVTKSITINEGEKFVVPSGATVISLFTEGTSSYTSNCDNLPTPAEFRCWTFTWEVNALSFTDATFVELILKNEFSYTVSDPDGFPSNQWDGDGNNEAEKLTQAIQAIPNFPGDVIAYDQADVSVLRQIKISLPYFGVKPLLKVNNPTSGNTSIMYLEGTESGCEVPGGWTAV